MSFEILFFLIFAGGWTCARLATIIRLPPVLGMTLYGVLLSLLFPIWSINLPAGFLELAPFIKSLALIVILLRAGLGISMKELKSAGLAAVLMSFVPCLLEGAALTLLFHEFFAFSWPTAGLTAFMLAAVSPAVVVPSMLELREQGLGTKNSVITTVLAGASVDDVFAITLFTVFLDLASPGTHVNPIVQLAWIPVALIGGLALGAGLGLILAVIFKSQHTKIRATEKTLLLLALALLLVQIGSNIHLAGLLGLMAAGFVLLARSELQAHELAAKLGKVWVGAQIALFVIIGLSIDASLALQAGPRALLVIIGGLLARSLGVILATIPSRMNWRERLFCIIAYLPKATVQAALGGIALSRGLEHGATILAIAVLAIIFTAPLGLIGIRIGSKHLLHY